MFLFETGQRIPTVIDECIVPTPAVEPGLIRYGSVFYGQRIVAFAKLCLKLAEAGGSCPLAVERTLQRSAKARNNSKVLQGFSMGFLLLDESISLLSRQNSGVDTKETWATGMNLTSRGSVQ